MWVVLEIGDSGGRKLHIGMLVEFRRLVEFKLSLGEISREALLDMN